MDAKYQDEIWKIACERGIDVFQAEAILKERLEKERRQAERKELQRKAAERERIRQEAFSEVESEIEVMESQIQTQEENLEQELEATKTERGNLYKLITERGKIYDDYFKKLMDYKKQVQDYEEELRKLTRENFKIVELYTEERLKPVVKMAAMMLEKKLKKGTVEIRMNEDGSYQTLVGVTPNDKPREYSDAEIRKMVEKARKGIV